MPAPVSSMRDRHRAGCRRRSGASRSAARRGSSASSPFRIRFRNALRSSRASTSASGQRGIVDAERPRRLGVSHLARAKVTHSSRSAGSGGGRAVQLGRAPERRDLRHHGGQVVDGGADLPGQARRRRRRRLARAAAPGAARRAGGRPAGSSARGRPAVAMRPSAASAPLRSRSQLVRVPHGDRGLRGEQREQLEVVLGRLDAGRRLDDERAGRAALARPAAPRRCTRALGARRASPAAPCPWPRRPPPPGRPTTAAAIPRSPSAPAGRARCWKTTQRSASVVSTARLGHGLEHAGHDARGRQRLARRRAAARDRAPSGGWPARGRSWRAARRAGTAWSGSRRRPAGRPSPPSRWCRARS